MFDRIFGTVMAVVMAAVFVWAVVSIVQVDRLNDRFTFNCDRIGGTTIITDKDLCLSPDGRILAHE